MANKASAVRSLVAAAAALGAVSTLPSLAAAHEYKVGSIEIGHPWSRAMPPGARTGVGYLVLKNDGTNADRLVSVSSPAATSVEVHDMSITDGVMTMRKVEGGLDLTPGSEAKLAPGGLHLMLVGVKEPFKEGQMVPLDLTFEKAGTVEVQLKVDAMGAKSEHTAHAQ
ncbi:copper chaperone PCu(A)C [Aureimonas phyllosphaerae]|uniref:Copper(I)-binding protein n=1 Tax=Aureimonas phyllosphaerae TaxID=1166078 RepID=A0A7W6BWM5_9HYPH|nr:copper chaperone PCu(A)C [Aureimonas phyllosphaerae]MBB3935096.1 hypothetical protein [Aureimonas phyllosphaerae]MBB3959104.1 hypothetical protein [Aureimonas phyllosphaerae]SFF07914.1 hypothetical protein SAMN05216566_102322 [Aureimonas phyllosphaerae]